MDKELESLVNEYCSQLKNISEPVIIKGTRNLQMAAQIIACLKLGKCYVPVDTSLPQARITQIENSLNNFDLQNLSYIMFTSGTTGTPKGIGLTKESVENFSLWFSSIPCLEDLRARHKTVNILNTAKFNFDLSLADLMLAKNSNTRLFFSPDFSMENFNAIFSCIKENQIHFITATPTYIKLLLTNPDFNHINFPDLECIFSCGEKLEPATAEKLLKRFPDLKLINAYGPTETVCAVSAVQIDSSNINSIICNGLLPAGNILHSAGLIHVCNEQIILEGICAQGYYSDCKEKKSIDILQEEIQNLKGFFINRKVAAFATGDRGFIKNNFLYINGRFDRQIKYKGYRIECDDIENNLLQIEGVKDACVLPVKDDFQNVKYIKAFIVPVDSSDFKKENCFKQLEKLIPWYMIPKDICIMENLPVNSNGKTDYKKLQELSQQ